MSSPPDKYYTGKNPNRYAKKILNILSDKLPVQPQAYSSLKAEKEMHDPFRTLVVTVLSQNSTDKGAMKALESLDKAIGGISPEKLAMASVVKIRHAIIVGGMQEHKAKGLKELSRIILEKYDGHLRKIFENSLEEARNELMELPQVGPKTADVLLVTSAGRPTIPIDTHCDRVSRRLSLAPLKGGYEKVRESLQNLYPPSKYHSVHLLLIAHGRTFCTALRPKCPICPVRRYCPYPYKTQPLPPKPSSRIVSYNSQAYLSPQYILRRSSPEKGERKKVIAVGGVCPYCHSPTLESQPQDSKRIRFLLRCHNPNCTYQQLIIRESCCE